MPFRSKAQQRLFFAKEQRGELPKGTARRWAHETSNLKSLPERVSKNDKKGKKKAMTIKYSHIKKAQIKMALAKLGHEMGLFRALRKIAAHYPPELRSEVYRKGLIGFILGLKENPRFR